MITFRPTEIQDLVMVTGWTLQDPVHKNIAPAFWTEPAVENKHVCYVIEDEEGPVIFVRQEREGNNLRLHTQFPPDSRKRVAASLERAYPFVKEWALEHKIEAIVFESESPTLIRFMARFGFKAVLRHQLQESLIEAT